MKKGVIARHHLEHLKQAESDLKANGFAEAAEKIQETMKMIAGLPEEIEKPEKAADYYTFCPFGCGTLGKHDRIHLQPEEFGESEGLTLMCRSCLRIFNLNEDGTERLEGEEDLPKQKLGRRFNRIKEKIICCPTCGKLFVSGLRQHGNCSEACYKREIGEWETEVNLC